MTKTYCLKKEVMQEKFKFFIGLLFFIFCDVMAQDKMVSTEWETMSTIDAVIPRHENSFVAVKDKFYVLGGRGIKPISIYDTKSNTWTTGKESPVEIHHFQAVTYKNKIVIIGAMTGKYPYETPLAQMLIYDPIKDLWENGPEIPKNRRRGSCGVVVQGHKVYLVGGIVDGHNSGHVPWLDVYDFKKKSWTILADGPRARDHFHAVIGKGKIYAVGGRNSSFATQQTFELTIPEIDVFDIKTKVWDTFAKENNLPTERAGTSAVFYKNQLIVIGGESGALKTAHTEVEAFKIKTREWKKLSSLHRGRHGTQAIRYKKDIYTVAGSGNRGGKPELASMEKLSLK